MKREVALIAVALLLTSCAARRDRAKVLETPDLAQTCKAAEFYRNGGVYCGPVAVSNSLVWLGRRGLLPCRHETPEDQYALVKELASERYMKTDQQGGTGPFVLIEGVWSFLKDKGVEAFDIRHCGWRPCPSECDDGSTLTLKWIAEHVSGDQVQWWNIGWYKREEGALARVGGHWLTVVGVRDGKCRILDPAPRNGVEKVVHALDIVESQGVPLKGRYRNMPETSQGMLQITNGFTMKSIADVCFIDSAVSLRIE